MDEWDQVRQKIKELENSFLKHNPDVRAALDGVSVADFWKNRYENEKQVWEETLAAKEQEQAKIQEKFLKDDESIRDLNFKIRELEQTLSAEKALWEERSRFQTVEAELDKKKLEWEDRLLALERENHALKSRIQKGSEESEAEARRRQDAEAEKQKAQEELNALRRRIEEDRAEDQKRIEKFQFEKESLEKRLEDLRKLKDQDREKLSLIEKDVAALNAERARHLAQIQERQKEQFLAFEDLARGFAHKVRNNLSIMAGILQLCLKNAKMSPELKTQLETVDENSRSMLQSIEEFLALSRIPEMAPEQRPVNELLDGVIASLEEEAQARGVKIEKEFSQNLAAAPLDAALFGEAVRQLILNAVEASASESAVVVSAHPNASAEKIIVRVADSGKGIPEKHIKKIFQPYFSTKKGKKGLGLTIAKRAVELHHGSLTVTSPKGEGATATIQIPIPKNV